MKTNFELNGPISDWRCDSMLHEKGEVVCTLTAEDYIVEIGIEGSVRVVYKDEPYRNPYDFPEEVKQAIREHRLNTLEDCYVDMNNWYELCVFEKSEDGLSWNYIDGEVLDWEDNVTEEELKSMCEEWLETVQE